LKPAKIIFSSISILMLLLAIPKGLFPYGYYNLLRLIVCGTGIFLAVISYQQKNTKWTWTMGTIAFVFNPIFPIHLGKEIWVVIDIIVAIIIFISLFAIKVNSEGNIKRNLDK